MVEQKYLRGGRANVLWRGQKYIKYNKINNNSENFRWRDCLASLP